jgi:hypothetical protein
MFDMTVASSDGSGRDQWGAQVIQIDIAPPEDAQSQADPVRERFERILEDARERWSDLQLDERLIQRALTEALDSDPVLGDRPETWSPLGELRSSSFGGLAVDESVLTDIIREEQRSNTEDVDSAIQVMDDVLPGRQSVIRLVNMADGFVFGAMAFGSSRFIAPLLPAWIDRSGWSDTDIHVNYAPSSQFELDEAAAI